MVGISAICSAVPLWAVVAASDSANMALSNFWAVARIIVPIFDCHAIAKGDGADLLPRTSNGLWGQSHVFQCGPKVHRRPVVQTHDGRHPHLLYVATQPVQILFQAGSTQLQRRKECLCPHLVTASDG